MRAGKAKDKRRAKKAMGEKIQETLLMQHEGNTSSRPAERGACWVHCLASAANKNRLSVFHLWHRFTPNTGEWTRTWQNSSTQDWLSYHPDWCVETMLCSWSRQGLCSKICFRFGKNQHIRLDILLTRIPNVAYQDISILISHLSQSELPNCVLHENWVFFKETWRYFQLCL